MSFRDLWRRRKWTLLLELIDRLPRDTYYWQVITNDPEYAEQLAAASEGNDGPHAPPMSTWSQEVQTLTEIADGIDRLIYVTRAAAGSKNEKPPKPRLRPFTLLPRMRDKRRQDKHNRLADRLLGR